MKTPWCLTVLRLGFVQYVRPDAWVIYISCSLVTLRGVVGTACAEDPRARAVEFFKVKIIVFFILFVRFTVTCLAECKVICLDLFEK